MKILITALFASVLFTGCLNQNNPENPVDGFSTGGHTAYHLRPASIDENNRGIVAATIDGYVLCYNSNKKLQWKTSLDGEFPFDLCVKDIDNDGLDESFVVTGNGTLFALNNEGKIIWKFSQGPPLYQVSVAINKDGEASVAAGGVGEILYLFDKSGNLKDSVKMEACIRHLRSGDITGDGNDDFAVATTTSGLIGNITLSVLSTENLSRIWSIKNISRNLPNSGRRLFSMLITDVTGDDKDEIIVSHGWGDNGQLSAYNSTGELVFSQSDERIPNIPYRMNLLRVVDTGDDKFIIGHFGYVLIIYNLDGSLRETLTSDYAMADSYYDPSTKTFYLGSSVSGGDGIYKINVNTDEDLKPFENMSPVGQLAVIEENLQTLFSQIENFAPPDYQPEPKSIDILASKPADKEYDNISFIKTMLVSQIITNPDDYWCSHTDRRRKYNLTADQIVDIVSTNESEGNDILFWAGHGAGFFYPIETFERMILAGPNHLKGFLFAEMEKVDQTMINLVQKGLLPLAELCLKYDKKIYFRNKNIFWNGTINLPFWKEVILNERFKDVFVPGLEETNCRTQELSLSGRIGLWKEGYINQWSCRMVTDNVNFDRLFEWGGQQVPVHHFRHLVSRGFLGATVFINNLHQGENFPAVYNKIIPFYDMLDKGIIHVPDREDLLSVSKVKVGMTENLSERYIEHGKNGHTYWFPEKGEQVMVFNRMDTYWGGSNLPEYDFSVFSTGETRRMTNFLPPNPYGIVPIVPLQNKENVDCIITDGEFYYVNGIATDAPSYATTVLNKLKAAAADLPLLVGGGAHWSAVRLDESHIRILLMDPGYLNPGNHTAEIYLQKIEPIECRDILSGESLSVKNGRILAEIPIGLFRIIDIKHELK
jgi:lambda-carrageenase